MIKYLLIILESHLTNSHAPILLQIRPWRVDDSDVVLLVTCWSLIIALFKVATHHLRELTLNTVCLGQLRAVNQQRLADLLPALAFRHTEIDMCR